MTKMYATLPKGEGNGLAAIARELIDEPREVRVAIVLFDCRSVTRETDTGATEPTARIRRIEPVDGDDKETAIKILQRAMEKRTGNAELPLEEEAEEG